MDNFTFLKTEIENSYLSKNELIHSTTGDGRLDSAESEIVVINHLIELFNNTDVEIIPAVAARNWYDIIIKINDKIYPVNIKITQGNSADNVSSKEGLFYTLTGIFPEKVKGLNQWKTYNSLLIDNLKEKTDTDYYFVIYFKEDETFLFTSLKNIENLTPNGNNLPFQCNWSDNCQISKRTEKEQLEYLMNTYFSSWVKKVGGFEPLMKWKEGK